MKTLAAGVIALLSVTPGAAAAEPPFIEDPAFATVGTMREQAHGRNEGPVKRASIDVEILAAVIRERAERAAIEAMADALAEAGAGQADRLAVREVLESAAAMLASRSGVHPREIRVLLRRLLRAAIAEAVVRTAFPTDADLRSITTRLRLGLSGSPRRVLPPPRVRGYLVDWAYHLLATQPLCPEARPARPRCPFRDAAETTGRALCRRIEADPSRLDALLGVDARISAVVRAAGLQRALSSLPRGAEIDLEALVRIASRTSFGQEFAGGSALDPARWMGGIEIETGIPGLDAVLPILRAAEVAARAPQEPDAWTVRALRSLGLAAFRLRGRRPSATVLGEVGPWLDALADLPEDGQLRPGRTLPPAPAAAYVLSWLTVPDALESLQSVLTAMTAGRVDALPALATTARTKLLQAPASQTRTEVIAWLVGLEQTRAAAPAPNGLTALSEIGLKDRGRADARRILVELAALNDTARSLIGFLGRNTEGASLGDIPLRQLDDLVQLIATAHAQLDASLDALSSVAPRAPSLPALRALRNGVVTAGEAVGVLASVEGPAATGRARELLAALASLGVRSGSVRGSPLVALLDPILARVRAGRAVDGELVIEVLRDMDPDRLVADLGLAQDGTDACADDASAGCWLTRLLDLLQDAMVRDEADDRVRLRLDGARIAEQAASLGDDFRRGRAGQFFFHLTIGMGGLYSSPPRAEADGRVSARDARLVALAAEQIGGGVIVAATRDREWLLKAGAYASGLLYRLLMDSAESEAVMGSVFLAMDLYELIELYGAAGGMLYPPVGDEPFGLRPSLSFGVQVPLGAYLERL